MLCAFLRVVQHMEKLPGCLGGQLLPHFVHTKACLKTQPLRWGLLEQKKTVHPRAVLGFTRKTFWTRGPDPQKANEDSSKQVSVHGNQRGETGLSMSQKVKEAGRDFSYLIVVFIGISITGGLLYAVFKELFSSSSPNIIYGKALGKCRAHPETCNANGLFVVPVLIKDDFGVGMGLSPPNPSMLIKVISVFGEPLKGYGEMSRRGRRQHVSFVEYVKDGLKRIRVKFYIEGSEPGKQGTVHAEVEENPQSGQFEFRYVYVKVTPMRSIIIEDNRSQES